MTHRQKVKAKRKAYQDYAKQRTIAYKILRQFQEELRIMVMIGGQTRAYKLLSHKALKRINALYRKTKEFYEISQRDYDEFK